MHDLVIDNAILIDGSGAPARMGITGAPDRISAIRCTADGASSAIRPLPSTQQVEVPVEQAREALGRRARG